MSQYRMSKLIQKEVNGNSVKYEAYREAWSRIKLAQEKGFFLEAITIEESIMSDRLISYLTRNPKAPDPKDKKGRTLSFAKLLEKCKKHFSESSSTEKAQELIAKIDTWRESRNAAIHAIVKSESGGDINTFLETAKTVADEGEQLAKELCKLDKRMKSQLKFLE